MVIVSSPLPPVFVAVTVYVVRGDTADGVPLISPVAVSYTHLTLPTILLV